MTEEEKYWKPVLENLLLDVIEVSQKHLKSKVNTPSELSIEFGDSLSQDLSIKASIIRELNEAMALSIDTKVRMLHSDWEEEMIQEEVTKIMKETGIMIDEPTNEIIKDDEPTF